MKAAPVGSSALSATLAVMPSAFHVDRAMRPKSSLPRREMKVTAAPARAAATDWFEPLPPGPSLKPDPVMVSPMPGMRPARKARSATKMPRMATPFFAMFSSGVRRDDALLEDEAAVEAPLAGLDHAIGLLREVVEGEALDRAHRHRLAFSGVDRPLHLGLDRRHLVRRVDDLHPERRVLDEAVERHHRQDRLGHPARRGAVDPKQFSKPRLPRHRVGREIGVGDDQVVAMAHRTQRIEYVG